MTVRIVDVYAQTKIPAPSANMPCGVIFNDSALGACVRLGLNPTNAVGDPIAVAYRGIVDVPSASATTLTKAATVEIVAATQLVVANAAGDFDIGKAVFAKTSGQTVARVLLNE